MQLIPLSNIRKYLFLGESLEAFGFLRRWLNTIAKKLIKKAYGS